MYYKTVALIVVSLVWSAWPACDSVDAAFDCNAICARYADCYDADYDTSACETRCRSHASDDEDFRRTADVCDACINGLDCTETVFSCADECVSVVP